MFCKNCGSPNTDGTNFCTKCGAKLINSPMADNPGPHIEHHAETSNKPNSNNIHVQLQKRRKNKKTKADSISKLGITLWAIAAAMVIAGGIIAYDFYIKSAIEESAEDELLYAGNKSGKKISKSFLDQDISSIHSDYYRMSPVDYDYEEDEEEEYYEVEPVNRSEIINGISVNWNNATPEQKSAVANILINMVPVEGGYFIMGTDDSNAYADEKPAHGESVSSFRIGKYEVTQKLWNSIMGYNPSSYQGDNYPVDNISWQDAQNFINRLNSITGLMFRLPTEAEWEFAAEGGNNSGNYYYSGSNSATNVGWTSENSGQQIHAVGSKQPNELGLYDMTGNVWEWTSQRWSTDYNSPRDYDQYVRRGGSAYRASKFCRLTYRNRGDKADNNKFYGLRLAL